MRWVRLVVLAVTVTFGLAAMAVGLPWLVVITPRWLIRAASISFLWALLAGYAVAVPAVLVGGVLSYRAAARARRRHDRASLVWAARGVLLASSGLASLILMEVGAEVKRRWSERIPALPTRFAQSPDRRSPGSGPAGLGSPAVEGINLVVVGESSALGEPYHPWLSVGQVVGWQLERVFPGRQVRVDVRADGGLCLEQAVLRLETLRRRPDALIVFAGHNEFQSRYGWSRNVRHYVEEGPESPLALLELARGCSSTAHLILATLDRYYGETPPPPRVTRELVDHPICAPKEYAYLREDFHRRLDALAGYCRRIGTLAILIVPGSNDGAFEPSRSVLTGSTPAAERAAFAREFRAARAAENEDAPAAIAAYRRLLDRHPEFAEAHYRLARLLVRAGAQDQDKEAARRHFILARDHDGLPLRCPSDFRAGIAAAARRHDAVLIDGPALLAGLSPDGILDDHLYHDAHHLNLAGTAALAQEILEQLYRRRAFGWSESTPVPRIELEDCARHFALDAARWAEVCRRTAGFYMRTAFVRYDPTERLDVLEQYERAARALDAGGRLPASSPPSLAMPVSILQPAAARPAMTGSRAFRPALPRGSGTPDRADGEHESASLGPWSITIQREVRVDRVDPGDPRGAEMPHVVRERHELPLLFEAERGEAVGQHRRGGRDGVGQTDRLGERLDVRNLPEVGPEVLHHLGEHPAELGERALGVQHAAPQQVVGGDERGDRVEPLDVDQVMPLVPQRWGVGDRLARGEEPFHFHEGAGDRQR
jgi:hypothetical protein